MFIAFEGIDCSGKSTQIKKLKKFIESNGYEVWTTKEPSEGPIGKLIRNIQKGQLIKNPNEDTMLYLYTADRSEHQKEIRDHLDNNEVIICDRYKLSSEAYQGFDKNHIEPLGINDGFISPDFTFIIDIPEEVAIQRIQKRGNPVEIFEKIDFLKKVREKYKSYLSASSIHHQIYLIDGTKTEEEVFEEIKKVVNNYL